MDVVQTVLDAARNNDWEAVRLQLHPYLHWYDASGEVRGRNNVVILLKRGDAPAAAAYELRNGQIYRWWNA
jgi:hypothetical protein